MIPAGTMVAAAESKSASLADLPDAVLCEHGLYGYRLALEIFDNEIFAVLGRWKQPADIRLDFRFTGAIPRLLDMAELVPGPQRDRIFTRFREMQGEALKELEKMQDAAEKRAQAKSASLADLPDAVLCERVVEGYDLEITLTDGKILAAIGARAAVVNLADERQYTRKIQWLMQIPNLALSDRNRIDVAFHHMRRTALIVLENMQAKAAAESKSASLADLPGAAADTDGPQADLRRREELLADLRALRADQFAALLGELLGTAGMEAGDLRIYTTVLRERLTPDAPLTWQAVLAKTLLKKGPQK